MSSDSAARTAEDTAVRVDPRAWPDFGPAGVDPDRRRDRAISAAFVVFLVPDVVHAVQQGRPALTTVLAVGYGATYVTAGWPATRWGPRGRTALVVALFGLGIGYLVAAGANTTPAVLGYALAMAIMLLPLRWSRWIGPACILGALAYDTLTAAHPDSRDVLVLGLITAITLNLTRMARLLSGLRDAQAEVRVLAVAGERARLARDLHDVLGHSLTTITVKAGLARRLLERDAPTDRVLAEVRDAEDLSRRALADIRATVSAQRRASLAAELVSARAVLRAAGIEPDLPGAVDDVAADLEEPLAYVLREGVTNVVRHSGARRCTVRLGPRWLEVRDDGPSGDGGPSRDGRRPGNGLTGLAERMAAVGGTVAAGPVAGGGFRLRADAPDPRGPA